MKQFQRTDLDILTIFLATYQLDEEVVFLHSGQNSPDARYSILAHLPFASVTQRDETVRLNGEPTDLAFGDAVDLLRAQYPFSLADWPLQPELIGFVSYEQTPARFAAYDEILLMDHQTQVLHVVQFGQTTGPYWLTPTNQFSRPKAQIAPQTPAAVFFDQVRDEYVQTVEKMRDYMAAGDIYVANLTQQLTIISDLSPLQVFEKLLTTNPAPFGGFYQYPDWQMTHISSSVERFVQIDHRQLRTKPIKGTIARGKDAKSDAQQAQQLASSAKDRSELLMVTDLLRNDVSRISEPFSVQVPKFAEIETFAHVHQLVTTITSTVKADLTFAEFLRALFPGGSITGTPKKRAHEIIAALEKQPRGIYTGMQGWLSHDLQLDMNIAIRTLAFDGDKYQLGVGGGVTFDSDAQQEFDELLVKARPFLELFGLEGEPQRLFSTMRVENGEVVNLTAHVARLEQIYRVADLTIQLQKQAKKLKNGVLRAETDGYHWWFSTRDLTNSTSYRAQIAPTSIPTSKLYAYKISGERYQKFHQPVLQTAHESGFDDVLFHIDGRVTEFSIGNFVGERAGKFYTPARDALLGTELQRFAQTHDMIWADIYLSDLATFDVIYMTNAVRGVVAVELTLSNKTQLRQQQKARLKASLTKEVQTQNLLAQLQATTSWQEAKTIGITLSLPFELNTDAIIKSAWAANKRVIVPKVVGETLSWFILTPKTPLSAGAMNIKEPTQAAEMIAVQNADLLIVPGLAFTRTGQRLGFGGGFYDRVLRDFAGDTVALALAEQLLPALPTESHDQNVQQVLAYTPS